MKLNPSEYYNLISKVKDHYCSNPELTWSQAFMAVYRRTIDSSETNRELLSARGEGKAFELAKLYYLGE